MIHERTSKSRKFLFLRLLKTCLLSYRLLVAQDHSRSGQLVVITFLRTLPHGWTVEMAQKFLVSGFSVPVDFLSSSWV